MCTAEAPPAGCPRQKGFAVTATRLIVIIAAASLLAGQAAASPPLADIPLPRPRPALPGDSAGRVATRIVAAKPAAAPLALAPQVAAVGGIPSSGVLGGAAPQPPRSPAPSLPLRSTISAPMRTGPPLVMAATSTTSPLDVAAAKQALEFAKKSRTDEATNIEGTIADPLARKLVEWVILRSDDSNLDFARYAAFIAANPSWPGLTFLRRRAEAAMWQQPPDRRAVIAFFTNEGPHTAKGRLQSRAGSARRRRPRRRRRRGTRSLAQGRLFRRRGSAGAAAVRGPDRDRLTTRRAWTCGSTSTMPKRACAPRGSLATPRSPSPRRAPRSSEKSPQGECAAR